MRRRPLGNTGLLVTELALGTWGLSGDAYGPVSVEEQQRVLERALALGISVFETADIYGDGAMERLLGRITAGHRALVVTKLGTDLGAQPPRKRFDVPYLAGALERSRARLGRAELDVVLLHNPSRVALERGEATAWLAARQAAGEVKAWGVSVGDPETARAALAAGAQVLELAHNALHRSDLNQLRAELGAVGVLARSVLAHGLLTGHWAPGKEFPEGDHRAERWTSDELRRRLRQLDALRPAVGGQVLSLRAAALRFALEDAAISSVVLGPRSCLQLDQLVREAGRQPPYLEPTVLTALQARLQEVGVEP